MTAAAAHIARTIIGVIGRYSSLLLASCYTTNLCVYIYMYTYIIS